MSVLNAINQKNSATCSSETSWFLLSNELRETVRIRDAYINELRIKDSSNEVVESIEIMRRMQLDDMQAASRLMLMAREMQDKVHEKTNFIVTLRLN
ncbi:hypothetical protein Tco_1221972 [Tanacetum coccineum]